jgi:seryl-tRNA synthetase
MQKNERNYLGTYEQIDDLVKQITAAKQANMPIIRQNQAEVEKLQERIAELKQQNADLETSWQELFVKLQELAADYYRQHGNSPHRNVSIKKKVDVIYPPDLLRKLQVIAERDPLFGQFALRIKAEPNLQALRAPLRAILEGQQLEGESAKFETAIRLIDGATLQLNPIVELAEFEE